MRVGWCTLVGEFVGVHWLVYVGRRVRWCALLGVRWLVRVGWCTHGVHCLVRENCIHVCVYVLNVYVNVKVYALYSRTRLARTNHCHTSAARLGLPSPWQRSSSGTSMRTRLTGSSSTPAGTRGRRSRPTPWTATSWTHRSMTPPTTSLTAVMVIMSQNDFSRFLALSYLQDLSSKLSTSLVVEHVAMHLPHAGTPTMGLEPTTTRLRALRSTD